MSIGKIKNVDYSPHDMYKHLMPTQRPIIPVAMDDDMVKRIDDYRRSAEGNIPSRSEAIRRLINEGLSRHEKKPRKSVPQPATRRYPE